MKSDLKQPRSPPRNQQYWQYKYSHSSDGIDTNLLVLFHGLGDTPQNFHSLGVGMKLPQTAVLSLKGPVPIPFMSAEEGTGWFPGFDEMTALEILLDSKQAIQAQAQVAEQVRQFLKKQVFDDGEGNGWLPDRVLLLGYSQGGTMALEVALRSTDPGFRVGGVVSVSGWLYTKDTTVPVKETNVLVTLGNSDPNCTMEQALVRKSHLQRWTCLAKPPQFAVIDKKGHTPPRTAGEMRRIMEFFDANLLLRNIALENMSDIHEIKHR